METGHWDASQAENATENDKVNLIFAAGLSSKDEVSDVSGRGVGMDAVAAIIEELGGKIEVQTMLGKGTEFLIKIPGDREVFGSKAA